MALEVPESVGVDRGNHAGREVEDEDRALFVGHFEDLYFDLLEVFDRGSQDSKGVVFSLHSPKGLGENRVGGETDEG